MTWNIRPARAEDAAPMGLILQDWLETTPWVPLLHTQAETIAFCARLVERGEAVVAMRTDSLAGFMARREHHIGALYVARSVRGRGAGGALVAHAKAASDHLELWCFQANAGACRFYQRSGFTIVEETDGAGNDEGLPDYRLAWRKASGDRAEERT